MTKGLKALKRIRQETCPATYMPDFDKNQCCDDIEKELKVLEVLSNNKLLNLGLLDEYDICEYEEYYDETSGTTNELTYDEFVIIKEWQEINRNDKRRI